MEGSELPEYDMNVVWKARGNGLMRRTPSFSGKCRTPPSLSSRNETRDRYEDSAGRKKAEIRKEGLMRQLSSSSSSSTDRSKKQKRDESSTGSSGSQEDEEEDMDDTEVNESNDEVFVT